MPIQVRVPPLVGSVPVSVWRARYNGGRLQWRVPCALTATMAGEQHVNDAILQAMKRQTSRAQIVETVQKLRAEIPEIVIRTSLMVGFPGETEAQFQELLEFVETAELDNVGIFAYSQVG
eukprot:2739757-Rhodomonas_salina.2